MKTGTGSLTLTATPTYTGTTTISQGTLNATTLNSLGGGALVLGDSNTGSNNIKITTGVGNGAFSASSFTVSSRGSGLVVLELTAQNDEYAENLVLNRPTTLQTNYAGVGGAYFGTFNNTTVISGSVGTLTVQALSTGLAYIPGINTFVGTVNLPQGSVVTFANQAFGIGNAVVMSGSAILGTNGSSLSIGALTGASANVINVAGGGTLTIASPNSATFAGVISNANGTVNLTNAGSGTEILTGANTYGGTTTINAGTLQIGNGGATGSIANTSSVSGAGGTLAFDLSTSGTISQAISGGLGFTQAGTGSITLSNASYTGTTTVSSSGTLIVAGSISGNATTNSVSGGGTLINNGSLGGNLAVAGGLVGGSGTISGNLTVGNGLGASSSSVVWPSAGGALLASGDNTLTVLTGGLTLNSDAAYKFTLNSSGPFAGGLGESDYLAVNGALSIQSGAVLTGLDAGNTALTPGEQFLVAFAGGGVTGAFSNVAPGGLLQVGQNLFTVYYGTGSADLAYDDGGYGIGLVATAIPEPGTWATVLAGFAMLVGLQRRRRLRMK